jgi:hypothetical protein
MKCSKVKEKRCRKRTHAKKTPGLMLDRVEKEAASNSSMFVFFLCFLDVSSSGSLPNTHLIPDQFGPAGEG